MISFNQKGYVGKSMSVRAAEAYDSGEMPKSKWTKAAMLEAIADEFDDEIAAEFKSLKKDELFAVAFKQSSWHHTSKFCNCTDFYALDADKVRKYGIENAEKMPLTAKESSEHAALIERRKAAQKAREEAEEAELAKMRKTRARVILATISEVKFCPEFSRNEQFYFTWKQEENGQEFMHNARMREDAEHQRAWMIQNATELAQ